MSEKLFWQEIKSMSIEETHKGGSRSNRDSQGSGSGRRLVPLCLGIEAFVTDLDHHDPFVCLALAAVLAVLVRARLEIFADVVV